MEESTEASPGKMAEASGDSQSSDAKPAHKQEGDSTSKRDGAKKEYDEELRFVPDTGELMTFQDFHDHFKEEYDEDELQRYWKDECILDMDSDGDEEGEEEEISSDDQGIDPERGDIVSFSQYSMRYKDEYTPDDIKAYWTERVRVPSDSDSDKGDLEMMDDPDLPDHKRMLEWIEVDDDEEGVDPDWGDKIKFQEFNYRYAGEYTPEEVRAYWRVMVRPDLKKEKDQELETMDDGDGAREDRMLGETGETTQSQNQERRSGQPPTTSAIFKGERWNPDDMLVYTFEQLAAKYTADGFTEDEVKEYWRNCCVPDERRWDPHDRKIYNFEALRKKYTDEFTITEVKDYWNSDTKNLHKINFSQWLRCVEPSGSVACSWYIEELEQKFYSPKQVEDLFIIFKENGTGEFNEQFFKQANIIPEHQAMFQDWIAGKDVLVPKWDEEEDEQAQVEQSWTNDDGILEPVNFKVVKTIERRWDPADEKMYSYEDLRLKYKGVKKTGEIRTYWQNECTTLSKLGFAKWLSCIDPSGSLAGYSEHLEDNFDNPEQLEKVYAIADSKGGRTLNPEFFEECEVESEKHKALFTAWFSSPKDSSSPGGAEEQTSDGIDILE